jgi:hypothetical protein
MAGRRPIAESEEENEEEQEKDWKRGLRVIGPVKSRADSYHSMITVGLTGKRPHSAP